MESTKLVSEFGVNQIDQKLIDRIEKLTNKPAHHFLRRGIFCGHRDLHKILDDYESGKGFYLYTGRGPSSSSLHLGHLIPLEFTRYLQEVFQVPLIIQMTDDEKFLRNSDKTLEQIKEFTNQNLIDLIAIGFDPKLTFIFSDLEQIQLMYPNILKMQRKINITTITNLFGLDATNNNLGHFAFPVNQAVPAISNTFPKLFSNPNKLRCLVPCAIDQDVYFRMTRDLCHKIKQPKPSVIHSIFLPDIRGQKAIELAKKEFLESNKQVEEREKEFKSISEMSKMSSTSKNENPAVIFLNYTPKQVAKIVNRHAFSGGQIYLEDQKKLGANLDIDMSYRYLQFFFKNDQQLEKIAQDYSSGKLMTGEIKKILIDCLNQRIGNFQIQRKKVTPEIIEQFKSYRQLN